MRGREKKGPFVGYKIYIEAVLIAGHPITRLICVLEKVGRKKGNKKKPMHVEGSAL